jgi:hypothetical protein
MSAIAKVEKEKVNTTKTKIKLTLGFINGLKFGELKFTN